MYLKSLSITNYRKFGSKNNTTYFVTTGSSSAVKDQNPNISKVASATTLIVGKNNSGKTTITNALKLLLENQRNISGNDFNFNYLKDLLMGYKTKDDDHKFDNLPTLSFKLTVSVNNYDDSRLTNLAPFLTLDTTIDNLELEIGIKYEIKEAEEFKLKLQRILVRYEDQLLFTKFLELISESDFITKYLDSSDNEISHNSFRLNQLIQIKLISANKNLDQANLSRIFNKIIKNLFSTKKGTQDHDDLIDKIDTINTDMTTELTGKHSDLVKGVLQKIESTNNLSMRLRSDLDFDKLMSNLIKYEYSEHGLSIPENQFGLGYTNLVNIIGEIIDYVEQCPDNTFQSKINLICIEEPENFMHPQMQELFIKYIDDAVQFLLDNNSHKNINSQLIITTHSSHILNSKIHSSNSFNNINYITGFSGEPEVVKLDDQSVSSQETFDDVAAKETVDDATAKKMEERFNQQKLNDLKFLKTHIKYKVSELFFADAVIFVEGVTEETLINHHIAQTEALNKCYISVFNINGAHGLVYHPLIKLLKIPTLIITDLDIKRSDKEKDDFSQISDLKGKQTTNATIKKFNQGSDDISQLHNFFEDDNIYCVFQKDVEHGVYATSFEEAYILKNYQNPLLNKILKNLKPTIYTGIVGAEGSEKFDQLISQSYKLQRKLSKSKSDFANTLLYEMVTNDDETSQPEIPRYIVEGLTWLQNKIDASFNLRKTA